MSTGTIRRQFRKKKRIIDINIVCDIIPREWDKSNPANIALKLKHKEYTTL